MATVVHKGGNKWLLKVSDGFDSEGNRRRPTRMFEGTPKQAQKAAILFEEEVKHGKYCDAGNKYTFATYIKEVWAPTAERNLAPKTYSRYQALLNRIIPEIGHLKLDKIRPLTIRNLVNTLEDAPREDGKEGTLSPRTVLHHFRCLSSVLQEAVELDMIPENPCRRVKTPKAEKTEAKCYDEEQTNKLLLALEDQSIKYKTLVYLAIASGAREGEIMGLEWRHINFKENTIRIEQASQYLVEKGTFQKDTKNKGSRRTVAIPANVTDLLKEHRTNQLKKRMKLGNLWQGPKVDIDNNFEAAIGLERVFTTWDGRPGYPGWPEKWLHKFLEEKQLEHVPFHSLRHLSATLLINENIPLKTVSSRLGHTVLGTTSDIYAHPLESVDRKAANKLGKILDISKKQPKGKSKKA